MASAADLNPIYAGQGFAGNNPNNDRMFARIKASKAAAQSSSSPGATSRAQEIAAAEALLATLQADGTAPAAAEPTAPTAPVTAPAWKPKA